MGKILVTGGTGYIGSHSAVELLNAGHEIVIIDNLCNSNKDTVTQIEKITGKQIKFIKADITDKAAIEKVFQKTKFDCVFHFAGLKAVGESMSEPIKYYQNNVGGTVNLLECMLNHGVNKIVFSSSATVYAAKNKSPIGEDAVLETSNVYGETKLIIENMLKDLCRANKDFCAIILRYFNPIGAHESGLIGENPNGIPNNLAPYILKVALGELPHLNVFGSDYKTPDGTGVRDYIHVVDLARGHICAFEKIKTNGAHIYNLGTGKGTSVLEIIKSFERALGKPIPYKIAPRRAGDIDSYFGDPTKAKKELGWVAQFGIDEMCSSQAKFIIKQTSASAKR